MPLREPSCRNNVVLRSRSFMKGDPMRKVFLGGAILALGLGFGGISASAAPANGAAVGTLAASQALVTDVRERRCETRCRHREFTRRVCVKKCVSSGDRF
jgi:hypothetical protein